MTDRSIEIGARIRELRQRQGMTQDKLAEACGVYGPNVISRWESGAQTPRLDTAARLAVALQVSLDALVIDVPGDADESKSRPREADAIRSVQALDDAHLEAVGGLLRSLAALSVRE